MDIRDRRKRVVAAVKAAGNEVRYGLFCRTESDRRFIPAGELFAVTLRYTRGFTELTSNKLIYHEGTLHMGGEDWKENSLKPGNFSLRDRSGFRPEGLLKILDLDDPSKPAAINPQHGADVQLLEWAERLIAVNSGAGSKRDVIEVPMLHTQLPLSGSMGWFRVREENANLLTVASLIFNLRRYRPVDTLDGNQALGQGLRQPSWEEIVPGMVAPTDGWLTPSKEGGEYLFEGLETIEIASPEQRVQGMLESVFGLTAPMPLYRLFTTRTRVYAGQALYSPLDEQTDYPGFEITPGQLAKREDRKQLLAFALLCNVSMLDECPTLDFEYVVGLRAPLVDMKSVPVIQRVGTHPRCCRISLPHIVMNLWDVPFRMNKSNGASRINKPVLKVPAPPPAQVVLPASTKLDLASPAPITPVTSEFTESGKGCEIAAVNTNAQPCPGSSSIQ